jgi:hypothetical protein
MCKDIFFGSGKIITKLLLLLNISPQAQDHQLRQILSGLHSTFPSALVMII